MTKDSALGGKATSEYVWTGTIEKIQEMKDTRTIRIKGVAAHAGETSKNGRHYMREALIRAVTSFIGRPVSINHAPLSKEEATEMGVKFDLDLIVGNVEEMDFDEKTDTLNYVADIKKEPYVTLLRQKSPEIKGVSIQADYLRDRCPDCRKEGFESREAFEKHMAKEHFKRNIKAGPWGIVGKALSLVFGNQTPGLNTTVSLAESLTRGFDSLKETVERTEMAKEKITNEEKKTEPLKETKPKQTITEKVTVVDLEKKLVSLYERRTALLKKTQGEPVKSEYKPPNVADQAELDAISAEIEGVKKAIQDLSAFQSLEEKEYPWDQCMADNEPKYGKERAARICAAIKNRTISHTMEFGLAKTKEEAIGYVLKKCESDKLFEYNLAKSIPAEKPAKPVLTVKEFKKTEKLPTVAEKLALGEPFAGYADFADCVSKNSDKSNPEAYCGSIKHQVECDMVHRNQVAEAVNLMETNLCTLREDIVGVVQVLTMATGDMTAAKDGITEDLKKLRGELGELGKSLAALPVDDKSWTEPLGKLQEQAKAMEEAVKGWKDDTSWAELLGKLQVQAVEFEKKFEALPPDDKSWIEPLTKLQEQIKTFEQTIAGLPPDDKSWIEPLAKTQTDFKAFGEKVDGWKRDTETILTAVDRKVEEKDAKIKTLEERTRELAAKLDEKEKKTVEETQSLTVRVDNLEAKDKGKFKEKVGSTEKPERPIITEDPLTSMVKRK